MRLSVTITTPDVPRPSPVALCSGGLEEKLAFLAERGCDGVELMVLEPTRVDVAALGSLLATYGLSVAAVASGALASQAGLTLLSASAEVRMAAQIRLGELIELAAALHAPLVTVGSFRGRAASLGEGNGRSLLVEALRVAAQRAERHKVRLAIEPLNRYETDIVCTVAEGLALIDEVGSDRIGLLLDTFHANIEEPTFEGAIKSAAQAGVLWHVHIADSNRLAPGWGHLNFAQIVGALGQAGYDGSLSAELFPLPDANTAADQFIRQMQAILPLQPKEHAQ